LAKTLVAALAVERTVAAELLTVLPNQTYLVDGVTMTGAEVVAQIDEHVTAEQQLLILRQQLVAAEAGIKGVRSKTSAALKTVKATAGVVLGNTSKPYLQLGFPAGKQRKTTIAAQAVGIEKSHATREARGTKGPRQKASIHGTVPAATTTTPAPATPATVK
jgi:glutamate 5-kinase